MAPRQIRQPRQQPLDEIYNREENNQFDERVNRLLDERLERVVEQLAERVENLFNERERNYQAQSTNESTEDERDFREHAPFNRRVNRRADEGDDRRWESGIKTDIPEFHGSLQAEEFLDWLANVEEVLEFHGIPEGWRVALITTLFRGRPKKMDLDACAWIVGLSTRLQFGIAFPFRDWMTFWTKSAALRYFLG